MGGRTDIEGSIRGSHRPETYVDPSSESSLILDVFPSWVPLRAIHRAITEIIYRAIYTILDDHKMDKWTKSRVIYHKNHKNREYRGFTRSQCKCRAE